ncbi:MAG TPA: hypothetical protein VGI42_02760 [Chthoniobacterales bacterium]
MLPPIALSPEHRALLDGPVDERVNRILAEIEAERAEAVDAVKARRIIHFPFTGSQASHAVRDQDGHWHIVKGPPPERDAVAYPL